MKKEKHYFKTIPTTPPDRLVASYLDYLQAAGTPRGPYTLIRRHLTLFCDYLEQENPLQVNYKKAAGFVSWLAEHYSSYSCGYITNIIKSVRGFYRYLVRKKIIHCDPFLYVNLPRVDRMLPRDIPTDQQVRKLIGVIPSSRQRDRAIIELLYGTGIRGGELLALRVEDLNLKEKYITIGDSKTKQERNVPVNDLSVYALCEYLEGERTTLLGSAPPQNRKVEHRERDKDLLFLKGGGFPLCRWRLSRIIEDYREKASLPMRLTPHSFRHACAAGMIASGCPLRYVQALLGHNNVKTTMIYTRICTDSLKKALDEVHPHGARR